MKKLSLYVSIMGCIAGLVIGYLMYGKLHGEWINPLSLIFLGKPQGIFGIGFYMVFYEIRKHILICGAVGLGCGLVIDILKFVFQNTGETQMESRKRPIGIIVIAVLLFIGAVLSLFTIFQTNALTSILLGIRVPAPLMRFFLLASICISIYCGIGLLRASKTARTVYLWYAGFGIINSILSIIVMADRLPKSMLPQFVIGIAIGVIFYVWVIFYLVTNKNYFVK